MCNRGSAALALTPPNVAKACFVTSKPFMVVRLRIGRAIASLATVMNPYATSSTVYC